MDNLNSSSPVKRSRGRPRKVNKEISTKNDLVPLLEPDLAERYAKAIKTKQKRLDAVYVDTVYALDAPKGTKIEVNIYRVQKKKSNKVYDSTEDFVYVGFNSEFIENLDTDIVPTPLGSADLVEEDSNEDDDNYTVDDDYYNY